MRDQEELPEIDRHTKTELGERREFCFGHAASITRSPRQIGKPYAYLFPRSYPKPPGQSPPPQALESTPPLIFSLLQIPSPTIRKLPRTRRRRTKPYIPISTLTPPLSPLPTKNPNPKKRNSKTYHSNSSTQSNYPPYAPLHNPVPDPKRIPHIISLHLSHRPPARYAIPALGPPLCVAHHAGEGLSAELGASPGRL